MANPNRVVGQVKIKVDGDILETDGQSTLDVGGPVREAVQGDYQAGSFRETTKESRWEFSILMKGRVSATAIRAIDNATLTMETDTGQVYVTRNAYCAEPPSFSSSDGKLKCVFQGPPANELRA